jgi:hypothetical protein
MEVPWQLCVQKNIICFEFSTLANEFLILEFSSGKEYIHSTHKNNCLYRSLHLVKSKASPQALGLGLYLPQNTGISKRKSPPI